MNRAFLLLASAVAFASVAACGSKAAPTCHLLDDAGVGIPTVLADQQNAPTSITVDSTYAYWTNAGQKGAQNGSVMRRLLTGQGSTDVLVPNLDLPGPLAVDSTSIYWTNGGSGAVMSVPLAGGTPKTLAQNQPNPWGIAVTPSHLYWANEGTGANSFSDGAIMVSALDGTGATALADHQQGAFSLALDDTNAYWTSATSSGNGSILKVPLTGGTPQVLAINVFSPGALAVANGWVYWVSGFQPAALQFVVATGGDAGTLLDQLQSPQGLALDAHVAYFTDNQAVRKVSLDGGPSLLVAPQQLGPSGITVDSCNSAYWVNTVAGNVVKVTPR